RFRLAIQQPPPATLFPYTTLFRSGSGSPAYKADKDEENDCARGGRDDLPDNIAAWEQPKLRQQPATYDGTDDADHDVPDETKARSEEHTSELQSRENLVCRLLLEK